MGGKKMSEETKNYDAGLLNDYGGGNIEWWQDYLRAEIGRANEYWREIYEAEQEEIELKTIALNSSRDWMEMYYGLLEDHENLVKLRDGLVNALERVMKHFRQIAGDCQEEYQRNEELKDLDNAEKYLQFNNPTQPTPK
jgi:hypothetical protein